MKINNGIPKPKCKVSFTWKKGKLKAIKKQLKSIVKTKSIKSQQKAKEAQILKRIEQNKAIACKNKTVV